MAEPLTTVGLVTASLAIKGLALIGTGVALAVGFHIGKKLTNRIDVFLFMHSKEGREAKKQYIDSNSERKLDI